MGASIRTFRHVRARVQRLNEEKWRPAWVEHIAQEDARIRLQSFACLRAREEVVVECYGDGTLVRFVGTVIAQAGQEFAMSITGSMTFEPSRESVRLCVENISGFLEGNGLKTSFIALDVSPKSLGGLADRAFTPTIGLRLSLQLSGGVFEAEVGVANCRADPSEPGYFRIGLHILQASRLDGALWTRMLIERAEAA